MSGSTIETESLVCRVCQHRGSDVQFRGCGCTLHARCVPLSLIIGEGNPGMPPPEGVPPPIQTNNLPCPVCKAGTISGMYLFPLSLTILDRAVELRKKCARAAARASAPPTNANGKRQRELDNDFHEVQAESSYLLLSHTRASLTSTMAMETDLHRTGRWTSEEIGYVDFLLNSFDRGLLVLPHGIKLNEFLGDVLLCKSSRLTKKMKNARLSTRSYELRPPLPNSETLDTAVMSTLQEKFLQSLSSEPTQLELLFNLTKLWRTHFSNLCLQVGYPFLEASDWVASLEAMEKRASEAEELIRKARRRRMGLALKTDVRSSNPGVFFADRPVQGRENTVIPAVPNSMSSSSFPQPVTATSVNAPSVSKDIFDEKQQTISDEDGSDADFIAHMLEISAQPGPDGKRNRLLSMDLDTDNLDDLFDPTDDNMTPDARTMDNGPYLQELVSFLAKNHLPFVHVDIWVPSFAATENGTEELRLYHAGYCTRRDVNPSIVAQFNEFGEYSKKFSFAPGVGLPGRVYMSGQPSWSTRVDLADPKFFERAGGARIYGVKTVLGIPLTSSIGKLVVAMYTMADIKRNEALIKKCVEGFANYSPEPKWRLIVEMGKGGNAANTQDASTGEDIPTSEEFDFSSCFDDEPAQSSGPLKPVGFLSTGEGKGMVDSFEDEQRIATLLGEYMPTTPMPSSAGESTTAAGAPGYLQEFMSLRLLLLRPRNRRTDIDNELIDVLKNSFHGYAKGNRRSGSELAMLLVKDWRFLKSTANTAPLPPQKISAMPLPRRGSATSINSKDTSQHLCHVMDTSVNTYSLSGAPTKQPSTLNFQALQRNLSARASRNSFDSSTSSGASQRRVSVTSEAPSTPRNDPNLVQPRPLM